jgi:hypothetical protein
MPFSHHLKESERTHDDVTTSHVLQVEDRKRVAKDCIARFEHLGKSINAHVQILEAVANDLKMLNTAAAEASAAQYANGAATLRSEFDHMQPAIISESHRLHSYIETCKAIEKAKQDWKTKKERYDKTRHKVHKMHMKNKSPEQIHVKELKLAAEEREYRDANLFLQTTAMDCITTGNQILCDAANTIASALSRNYAAITHAFQDAQPAALAKQTSLPAPISTGDTTPAAPVLSDEALTKLASLPAPVSSEPTHPAPVSNDLPQAEQASIPAPTYDETTVPAPMSDDPPQSEQALIPVPNPSEQALIPIPTPSEQALIPAPMSDDPTLAKQVPLLPSVPSRETSVG